MKNENDILVMINIIGDLGFTRREDRDSKRNLLHNNTSQNN